MHRKRWITALVALPFLIFLICQKPIVFSVLIAAVSLISLWEYYRIVFHDAEKPTLGATRILGYLIAPLIIFAVHRNAIGGVAVLFACNLLLLGAGAVATYKNNPDFLNDVAKQVLGLFYIPVLLSHLVLIQAGESGIAWIFLLLIITFTNDTGAYYTGRSLGKHKLCPSVSPGKTIEGAVGGLLV
ncbi:MAG: phosphatidate cytidylyltransferase, partial [Desulfobacterales bacterium]|nr:phosphatidate cytidylyltransferase [Desulfobacterales bacterium]